MFDFIKFIFSNFWIFLGFMFLLAMPCAAIANIGRKYIVKNDCKKCKNYNPIDKGEK